MKGWYHSGSVALVAKLSSSALETLLNLGFYGVHTYISRNKSTCFQDGMGLAGLSVAIQIINCCFNCMLKWLKITMAIHWFGFGGPGFKHSKNIFSERCADRNLGGYLQIASTLRRDSGRTSTACYSFSRSGGLMKWSWTSKKRNRKTIQFPLKKYLITLPKLTYHLKIHG